MKTLLTRSLFIVLALVTLSAAAADLDQAKSEGLIGERADGYLGLVVSNAPADVVSLVADVNERRKAEYERIAAKNAIQLSDVEALAGKKAIEKTRPGHWILLNGGWQRK